MTGKVTFLGINKESLSLIKFWLIFAISFYIFGYAFEKLVFFVLSFIFLFFIIFTVFFCRDPEIKINTGENFFLSPASGKIFEITDENGFYLIKIFMSIFNVHIQRMPVSGRIKSINYKKGKFLPADKSNAHIENEQNIIEIETNSTTTIIVKQISGIFARRIICWVKENDVVQQGDRIGMIKFGSQVDVFVPQNYVLNVKKNQKVNAGKTILATLKGN